MKWQKPKKVTSFEELVGRTREEAENAGELASWESMQYCFNFGLRLGARQERDACANICSTPNLNNTDIQVAILNRHMEQ